jgi:hypothetical protein
MQETAGLINDLELPLFFIDFVSIFLFFFSNLFHVIYLSFYNLLKLEAS